MLKELEQLNTNELQQLYEDNKRIMNDYYKEKIRMEMENNIIDDLLRKKCNHQWKIDTLYSNENTVYKCSICGIRQ
jgi:ribosomal protein S27E